MLPRQLATSCTVHGLRALMGFRVRFLEIVTFRAGPVFKEVRFPIGRTQAQLAFPMESFQKHTVSDHRFTV